MAKNRDEIAAKALELAGIKAVGEGAAAEDAAIARDALLALFEELNEDGAAFEFTVDTVPDHLFYPMAGVVAGRIAPIFTIQFDASASFQRLRRLVFPDDRVNGVSPPAEFF